MTPRDWNHALAPTVPPQEANRAVANYVIGWLKGGGALSMGSERLSTTDLVEAIYPERYVKTDAHKVARDRIFKALNPRVICHTGLEDCATQGQGVVRFGKTVHPLWWHAPLPKVEMVEVPRTLIHNAYASASATGNINLAAALEPYVKMEEIDYDYDL